MLACIFSFFVFLFKLINCVSYIHHTQDYSLPKVDVSYLQNSIKLLFQTELGKKFFFCLQTKMILEFIALSYLFAEYSHSKVH